MSPETILLMVDVEAKYSHIVLQVIACVLVWNKRLRLQALILAYMGAHWNTDGLIS